MATSKDLRAQRGNVWEQMKAINDSAEAENRTLAAEEQQSWDKADADVVELTERIQRMETSEEREREMAAKLEPAEGAEGATSADEARAKGEAYASAFDTFLRFGVGEMKPEQRSVLQGGMQTLSQEEQRDLGVSDRRRRWLPGPTGVLRSPHPCPEVGRWRPAMRPSSSAPTAAR